MDSGQSLRVARIVHGAISAGVVVFLAVIWLIRRGGAPPQPEAERTLLLVGVVLALSSVVASFVVPGLAARAATQRLASRDDASEDQAQIAGAFLTQGIVGWALVEGPALFFGVVALISGSRTAMGAMLGLLALLVARAPGREGFDRFVRETGREVSRLRSSRMSAGRS
jgi:hypothetical protein